MHTEGRGGEGRGGEEMFACRTQPPNHPTTHRHTHTHARTHTDTDTLVPLALDSPLQTIPGDSTAICLSHSSQTVTTLKVCVTNWCPLCSRVTFLLGLGLAFWASPLMRNWWREGGEGRGGEGEGGEKGGKEEERGGELERNEGAV